MGKVITVVVIALVVLAGGAAVFMNMNRNGGPSDTSNTQTSTMNMKPATSTDSAPQSTNNVSINNFIFSPSSITVKKGTTVTWTNNDSVSHTVTEMDGQTGLDSGTLEHGKSYSFTFNSLGTFKYHCSIHPSMVGTVTVTD